MRPLRLLWTPPVGRYAGDSRWLRAGAVTGPVTRAATSPPGSSRFAGNMERQQTDNLLKSHASGTYLIRERPAEAERFAISIKYVRPRARGPSPHALLTPKATSPPAPGCVAVE